MRRTALFVLALAGSACFDFDADVQQCEAKGLCQPRDAGSPADAGPGSGTDGGAGSDAGADAGTCDAGWCLVDVYIDNGMPTYRGLWGDAPNHVMMAGTQATFLIWDGTHWFAPVGTDTRRPPFGDYLDLWGANQGDVWLVGGTALDWIFNGTWSALAPLTSDGANAVAVRGLADGGSVFALNAVGTIVRWTGSGWAPSYSNGGDGGLSDLWVTSASDAWAVGPNGVVLHYQGTSWQPVSGAPNDQFNAVWASGPNDVWLAAGWQEDWPASLTFSLYRGDGGSFQQVQTTMWGFASVWGTGPDDVFIGQFGGVVLHWDGNSFSPLSTQASTADVDPISRVFGVGGTDVWALAPPPNLNTNPSDIRYPPSMIMHYQRSP